MYINYGDVNFFQYGILVNTINENEYEMLVCRPYDDEENIYQFGHINVNIKDKWIDKESVMSFIGMDKTNFDKIQYAIGCMEYYGWENFGVIDYTNDKLWYHMERKDIEKELQKYQIASNNLEITW